MMPGDQFLFTNALQIPDLFSAPFATTMRLAFILFSLMLPVAILHENIQTIKDGSDYPGLLIRVILVVSLLVVYDRFFTWIVYGMDLLSKAILPEEEFKEVVRQIFQEIQKGKDLGILRFFSIMTAMNFITYAVALALLGVITWLRFVFLSLLFVVGPILVGVSVYKEVSQGLRFWIKSLVSVSLWTVVLSILMKVISVMNITAIYLPQETNTASVFAANILFILLFISVPIIAHQITAGGTLSSLGSAVIGIGTAFMAKTITKPKFSKPNQAPKGVGGGYK
ncbi:MAG TPA: hypothetical protein PLY88_04155 [Candidatus Omnitrophota bacterium]|nr:hypothetical protein [Candidatus Omnitrophota bacterium]